MLAIINRFQGSRLKNKAARQIDRLTEYNVSDLSEYLQIILTNGMIPLNTQCGIIPGLTWEDLRLTLMHGNHKVKLYTIENMVPELLFTAIMIMSTVSPRDKTWEKHHDTPAEFAAYAVGFADVDTAWDVVNLRPLYMIVLEKHHENPAHMFRLIRFISDFAQSTRKGFPAQFEYPAESRRKRRMINVRFTISVVMMLISMYQAGGAIHAKIYPNPA